MSAQTWPTPAAVQTVASLHVSVRVSVSTEANE